MTSFLAAIFVATFVTAAAAQQAAAPPLVEQINGGNWLAEQEAAELRDELFYQRAIHAYLTMLPALNVIGMRDYEPVSAIDPELRGVLASIGIVKGEPFEPTERERELLQRAVETAPKMIFAMRQLGRPDGRNLESNHLKTVGDDGWFVYFRLYAPQQPFFDKTFTLDDLVE